MLAPTPKILDWSHVCTADFPVKIAPISNKLAANMPIAIPHCAFITRFFCCIASSNANNGPSPISRELTIAGSIYFNAK
ncbi:hypothetical protein D3C79_1060810 [compost metagenome]